MAKAVKRAPARKPVQYATKSHVVRLESKLAKVTAQLKAAKAKPAAAPKVHRKPSVYNKFVQKGLKQGKDFKTIAKDWKQKNG